MHLPGENKMNPLNHFIKRDTRSKNKRAKCPYCQGTGSNESDEQCRYCQGEGYTFFDTERDY